MLDDFVETIFHKPCQTSIPITYVRRCKTKKICHNKCEKNGRKYVTLFHVAKHCNIFHFFIRMFVTRCDHTMHFFVCFFLLLCVCVFVAGGILDILKRIMFIKQIKTGS